MVDPGLFIIVDCKYDPRWIVQNGFSINFLDVLCCYLNDFTLPLNKTASRLYIRQIVCKIYFVQLNQVLCVVLQKG